MRGQQQQTTGSAAKTRSIAGVGNPPQRVTRRGLVSGLTSLPQARKAELFDKLCTGVFGQAIQQVIGGELGASPAGARGSRGRKRTNNDLQA